MSSLAMPEDDQEHDTVLSITDDEDGGVTIDLGSLGDMGETEGLGDPDFDANLAETLEETTLNTIVNDLLEGIEADEQSMSEAVAQYDEGLDLMALKFNDPSQGGVRNKTSTLRHPGLLWAVVKFQANARGEMLPADGPAKVRNDGEDTQENNDRCEDLEEDLNHYLTVVAPEFYPDTDRMLFDFAYAGTTYKKVYYDPVRERPISEALTIKDVVVSADATDLANALRVTHKATMTPQAMRAMIDAGVWLDVAITDGSYSNVTIDSKEREIEGRASEVTIAGEQPHMIFECYTKLEIEDGEGLAPYRITLDKESREILEIRRNWKQDDEKKQARRRFVQYKMIPGFGGILGYGFVHLLGATVKTLTAILRMTIDAGMFSNFPGGVRSKGTRLENNEISPGPGEFPEVETNGMSIRDTIMALPYKSPGQEMFELMEHLEQQIAQMAGTIDVEVGDGQTNIPVGSILAQIEQQTQVTTAVHKRMHQSQMEELILLKELFAEYPECLYVFGQKSDRKWTQADLENTLFVPASDPNTPSQVHRLMRAQALGLLQAQYPTELKANVVVDRILDTMGISDKDSLMYTDQEKAAIAQMGQGGQGDGGAAAAGALAQVTAQGNQLTAQTKLAQLQLDAKKAADNVDIQKAKMAQDAVDSELDRQNRIEIEQMRQGGKATELAHKRNEVLFKHVTQPEPAPLMQPAMNPLMNPNGGSNA